MVSPTPDAGPLLTNPPFDWGIEDPGSEQCCADHELPDYNPILPGPILEGPTAQGPIVSAHHFLPARDCVVDARKQLWEWCRMWGPVNYMGWQLRRDYRRAVKTGSLEDWAENAGRQLSQGLAVLRTLQGITFSELPKDEDVHDLWRQVCSLFNDVYRGISIVQAWLELAEIERGIA
jgi:hypothetical protein